MTSSSKLIFIAFKVYWINTSIKGDFFDFFLFMYVIQRSFICRPSDSNVFGEWWDQTQDWCDFVFDSQTL
jgi:hypothetical protein